MKINPVVLYAFLVVVCVAFIVPTVMLGCATTKTTVTDPATGTVSVTDSYNLNTDQITSLVGIGSNVWGIINGAQTAQTTTTATPAPTTLDYINEGIQAVQLIMSAFKAPQTYKESEVQAEAVKIALAAYKEAGQFPPVVDIAKLVAARKFPTEKALIAFGKTGKLAE